MTPKITSRPIIEGTKTFQGLKLAFGGICEGCALTKDRGSGGGSGSIGRVTLRRTNVSSSASSLNRCAVGGSTGLLGPEEYRLAGSIPAAMVKSSTNSPTVL